MDHSEVSEMSSSVWFFIQALNWLNPVLHLLGLVIAVRAFRHSRNWGYLVVGFYFVLVLFSLLAKPFINRVVSEYRSRDASEALQQKIDTAVQQAVKRVLAEEGQRYTPPSTLNVHFPLGPIVLVAGLWLIAKREVGALGEVDSKVPDR